MTQDSSQSTLTAEPRKRNAGIMEPAAFAGMLYLILMAADLPLVGPLRAHDMLAPVLVGFFLLRFRELGRLFCFPDVLLLAFGVLALLASLTHLHGARDVYELSIFGYMGLLYLFFSRTRFQARHLWYYAVGVGAALWLVGAYQLGAGGFGAHDVYRDSTLSFLLTRFGFTFGNPNLFASFVALPLTCALIGLSAEEPTLPRATVWKRLALLGLLFGPPLLCSVSRHALLSGGLVLAWLSTHGPNRPRRHVQVAGWVVFILVALLFYLTILVPFFPLTASCPFFNCRTPGMYTIHQAAYARMVLLDAKAFIFGVGPTHAQALYPTLVDPVAAYDILAQYRMTHLLGSFLQDMDPHCEYLNLATAFGVPAMLACYAFFIALARSVARRCGGRLGWMIVYAVAGLVVVSLWDDILSKRWIWVMLGILTSRTLELSPLENRSEPQPETAA